ncbi:hypothetical protein TKK_0002980 [Trichogramma kaykai]
MVRKSKNFTDSEKKLLVKLLRQHELEIFARGRRPSVAKAKENAWVIIAAEFKKLQPPRGLEQLKKYFYNNKTTLSELIRGRAENEPERNDAVLEPGVQGDGDELLQGPGHIDAIAEQDRENLEKLKIKKMQLLKNFKFKRQKLVLEILQEKKRTAKARADLFESRVAHMYHRIQNQQKF